MLWFSQFFNMLTNWTTNERINWRRYPYLNNKNNTVNNNDNNNNNDGDEEEKRLCLWECYEIWMGYGHPFSQGLLLLSMLFVLFLCYLLLFLFTIFFSFFLQDPLKTQFLCLINSKMKHISGINCNNLKKRKQKRIKFFSKTTPKNPFFILSLGHTHKRFELPTLFGFVRTQITGPQKKKKGQFRGKKRGNFLSKIGTIFSVRPHRQVALEFFDGLFSEVSPFSSVVVHHFYQWS